MEKKIKKSKCTIDSEEFNSQTFLVMDKDSSIQISICLGQIIKGLRIDTGIVQIEKNTWACVMPYINGQSSALYDLNWEEQVNPNDVGSTIVNATLVPLNNRDKNKNKKARNHPKENHG